MPGRRHGRAPQRRQCARSVPARAVHERAGAGRLRQTGPEQGRHRAAAHQGATAAGPRVPFAARVCISADLLATARSHHAPCGLQVLPTSEQFDPNAYLGFMHSVSRRRPRQTYDPARLSRWHMHVLPGRRTELQRRRAGVDRAGAPHRATQPEERVIGTHGAAESPGAVPVLTTGKRS